VVSSLPATAGTGAMGREIESCYGLGMLVAFKENIFTFICVYKI
jgi:hypothetical protein